MLRYGLLAVLVIALTACSAPPVSTPAVTSVPISIPTESTTLVIPNALLAATPTSEAKATAEQTASGNTLENLQVDKNVLIQAAALYARAIGLTIPEVIQSTKVVTATDVNGNPFIVVKAKDGTPLLITQGDGSFQQIGLDALTRKLGFNTGTTVDGTEAFQSLSYQNVLKGQFGIVTTNGQIMPPITDRYGWEAGAETGSVVRKNNLILQLHPGFYPRFFPDSLIGANKDDIDAYVNDRVDHLLDLVTKDGMKSEPTYINFVNEAFWLSNGNVGWYTGNSNPLYKYYGKDWIAEIYTRIYQKGKEKGITVGKDLIMIYNESELFSSPQKANLVLDALRETKISIANRLGISQDHVQLDVGLELHLSEDAADYPIYVPPPSLAQLLTTIKDFSEIGSIHLTEFDLKNASDKTKLQIYSRVFQAAVQSKVVRDITFWNTLRFNGDTSSIFDYGPNGLFDSNFRPTRLYYQLLKSVLGILEQTQ